MKRLDKKEALDLLHHASLTELGEMAYKRKLELHPEKSPLLLWIEILIIPMFVVLIVLFALFYRHHKEDDAYILSFEEIGKKIEELEAIGGTQILFQGGVHPKLK